MNAADRFFSAFVSVSVSVLNRISPVLLWVCFILAHLWLGMLNLYGPGNPFGDVTSVYKFWIEQLVANGTIVGIDTQWVYPIVAYLPMLLSMSFGQALYGSTWLTIVLLLDAVAFGVLTNWGRSRANNGPAWWWIAFLLLLGPIAVGRIDSITIPLALIGVLIIATRPRLAAVVLTIATWIKVWPAALLAAIIIAARSRVQVAVTAALTCAAIIAVVFLLGGIGNVFSFISQQTGRGLQVEAPISTPFLWSAFAGTPDARVYYDFNILTYQVNGPGTAAAASLMTPLLALVAVGVCAVGIVAVRRGASTTQLLAPLALTLVTALIVFNKVGSPQFETWLAVPVILGLVTARNGGASFRTPAILVLVIAGMTQAIYPYWYGDLIALNPMLLVAVTVRNLLLIALFAWAISRVVGLANPSLVDESDDYEFELPKRTTAS